MSATRPRGGRSRISAVRNGWSDTDVSVIARSARDEAISDGVSCSRRLLRSARMKRKKVTPIRTGPRRADRRCCAPRYRRNGRRETAGPRACREPQHLEESKSVDSLLSPLRCLPIWSSTMRWALMRRYWPGPVPRAACPVLVDHAVAKSIARYSANSEELKVISLTRFMLSLTKVGRCGAAAG